ncbi:hypothetical protein [uncultured Polaribacter sp.]|uniref:hypothetical protein n=1 Tax=uncultured Polaribacter sp. TaxID=174711 RepID=UPI002609DECA|nr:hypothetical protein [uncultured Polaribacter sp.]
MINEDFTTEENKNHFKLAGFTSILIGAYFLISGYAIETILNGFLIDDNPLAMMSPEIIEMVIITIAISLFLLVSFTLFFSAKRKAKRENDKLWTGNSKNVAKKYIFLNSITFIILICLLKFGEINLITPVFLILHALLLVLFHLKERKGLLILAGVCLLFAIMCFVMPNYWSSSISILGIGYMAFGINYRK